jgi:hypothetical protein
MKPSGAHIHPEMGGGGSRNGWLVILAAIALAAIAGPAVHAIRDLIMAVAITVTAAVVLAAAGTAAVLVHRRRRDARALTRRGIRRLPTAEQRALGQAQEVHLHFHGVSAKDVAAIIALQDEAVD